MKTCGRHDALVTETLNSLGQYISALVSESFSLVVSVHPCLVQLLSRFVFSCGVNEVFLSVCQHPGPGNSYRIHSGSL